MNLQIAPPTFMPPTGLALLRDVSPMGGVTLRPVEGAAELAAILPLRAEIDLSAQAAAGPHFELLEKKETSAGASSPSSSKAP